MFFESGDFGNLLHNLTESLKVIFLKKKLDDQNPFMVLSLPTCEQSILPKNVGYVKTFFQCGNISWVDFSIQAETYNN